ncbi:MAG: hypothetical protein HY619_02730 [Thaumarchaeota archaeon]|nr:hypothetical protein [Nitrososphaerota archaeon]
MSLLGFSGLAAYLSKNDASRQVARYLTTMHHRAPAGYYVWSNKTRSRLLHDSLELPDAPLIIAGCLRQATTIEEFFIHGLLYMSKALPRIENSANTVLSTISESLGDCDGSYALIAPCGDGLVLARDHMGQKPLYFERRSDGLGVASNIDALSEPSSTFPVQPGYIYYADLNGEKRIEIIQPKPRFAVPTSMNEAATNTLMLLSESLEHRAVSGSRIAVASSGGVDSALIAFLLSKRCKVKIFSVFAEGSRDSIETEKFVEALNVDHTTISVSEDDAKRILSSVSKLIGGGSPMDLGIGMAIHLAARAASEEAFESLFLGQLADELFGGYSRYLQVLKNKGEASVTEIMQDDVRYAHKSNFERDEKAASPFLDLALPYAYLPLVQYALRISLKHKMDPESGERKIVLRKAAAEAGLPEEIWSKPKKAVQYSSGLQRIVEKILPR